MKIVNKRASFDYQLLEKIEAGILLAGSEAKSIRNKRANISQAYAKIVGNEAWLINANIPIEGKKDYNPTRSRKLLLHRSEILTIMAKIKGKNLTLVPVSLYTKGRLYKVELALAKAKRKFEKKQALKEADIKRNVDRELRGYKDN
jgi:SsrA-binding protein